MEKSLKRAEGKIIIINFSNTKLYTLTQKLKK